MSKLTLSFKGKLLKYFPLRTGSSVIGSDSACALFIDSLAIEEQHAEVVLDGDTIILRDLDTVDGTFVNDKRIDGEITLKDGDDIRVGKHNLRLTIAPVETLLEPARPPATTPPEPAVKSDPPAEEPAQIFQESPPEKRRAFLQILSGQNLGKTIRLTRNLTNLGTPGVQLAVIAHRNEGYFISHLEGQVPTQVNDRDIQDRAWQLQDGDNIRIGNVRILFTLS